MCSNLFFSHLAACRFVVSDLQKFSTVVQNAVAAPVHGEASPFILPTLAEVVLTALQESVLAAMDTLHRVGAPEDWPRGRGKGLLRLALTCATVKAASASSSL